EPAHVLDPLVEPRTPLPQRLGVVVTDLVDAEDAEARVLRRGTRQRLARRDQTAREDVPLDPVGRAAVPLPALLGDEDRLDGGAAAWREDTVDRGEERPELVLSDRLEHLDRDD